MSLFVSVCLSVCVSVCYNRSPYSEISKNPKCKNDVCRFWHLPSNCVIAKIVLRGLDLLCKGQRFKARLYHSSERPLKCDECEYFCTQISSLARYKLFHSSKRQFKFDDCEFNCDEDDICSKTKLVMRVLPQNKPQANSSQAFAPSKECHNRLSHPLRCR